MKKIKFPEKMFKNALSKCSEFKAFTNDVNEKTEAFDHYINTLCIRYAAYFEVVFKYHHINWPDKEEVYTCKFAMQPDDTIAGHVENYRSMLLDLFTSHFKDSFDTGDLEWYHKIDAISITIEEDFLRIDRLAAWSSEYVGIYWVEQECGEHWITLPKEPERKFATYLKVE
jgi:hypothetical protein